MARHHDSISLGDITRQRENLGHSIALDELNCRTFGFDFAGNPLRLEDGGLASEDPALNTDPWRLSADYGSITAEEKARISDLMESVLLPVEIDILHLHVDLGLSQAAIAYLYGISQPSVSYTVGRALFRLKASLTFIVVTDDEIRDWVGRARSAFWKGTGTSNTIRWDHQAIEVVVAYWHLRNQIRVQEQFGFRQNLVSRNVISSAERIQMYLKDEPRAVRFASDLMRLRQLKRVWIKGHATVHRAVLDLDVIPLRSGKKPKPRKSRRRISL